MSAGRRAVVGAVIVAIGIAAWQWWPTDTRRIKRKLDAIETTINERPQDGAGQLGRTLQLAKFVTDDVVLDPGTGGNLIQGRERLVALAGRSPKDEEIFTLSFSDVRIDITGEGQASVHLTAALTRPATETGEETVDAREVELEFRRSDDWRIARIVIIDALEKPPS